MITTLPKSMFPGYDTLLFVDTETTGFDENSCSVAELATVQFRRDSDGTWIRTIEQSDLIKLPEGVTMPKEAYAVNHIDDELLKNKGIERAAAFGLFSDLINDKTLFIGYNALFDYKFILKEIERLYKEAPGVFLSALYNTLDVDLFDPLLTARARVVGVDKEGNNIKHRLGNMLDYYNLNEVENSHRALADVEALISLTRAFHEERDDLSSSINLIPYYARHGVPTSCVSSYPDMNEKLDYLDEKDIPLRYEPMHFIDESAPVISKPHKALDRYDVPSDVMDNVLARLKQDESLDLDLVYVERSTAEADHAGSFQFIARDSVNGNFYPGTFNRNDNSISFYNSSIVFYFPGHTTSFLEAKDILNLNYVDADGFFPSSDERREMKVLDNLAAYYMRDAFDDGISGTSVADRFNSIYKRFDRSLYEDKEVNLIVYTNEDDLEVYVDVDLVRHRFMVEADGCMVYCSKEYDSNSSMFEDIPLNEDSLTHFHADSIGQKTAEYLMAYCFVELESLENGHINRNWISDTDEQLKVCSMAEDILTHPATYANKIDAIAEMHPDVASYCDKLKDIMDTLCDGREGIPIDTNKLRDDASDLHFDCNYYAVEGKKFDPFTKNDERTGD